MTAMDIGRATRVAPERRSFGLLARVGAMLKRIAERRQERATLVALARMDPYLLHDIGIEPQEIYEALDGRHSAALFNPIRKG
jgi:uncharacterized protein YjiS (DUF1127 family)